MTLNLDSLEEFARKGKAAQMAVDAITKAARECPYCFQSFLPQSWNQKFCCYKHRNLARKELKQKLR